MRIFTLLLPAVMLSGCDFSRVSVSCTEHIEAGDMGRAVGAVDMAACKPGLGRGLEMRQKGVDSWSRGSSLASSSSIVFIASWRTQRRS